MIVMVCYNKGIHDITIMTKCMLIVTCTNRESSIASCSITRRAKLGQIQGGGVAEGQPRFDKGGGGVAVIFLLFTR